MMKCNESWPGRWKVLLSALLLVVASATGIIAAPVHADAAACCWIATTDGATKSIRVFDPSVSNWNSPSALKWSWKPTASLGFSTAEINVWGGGSDVKLRNNDVWGGQWAAVSDGHLAAIVSYPDGIRKWATTFASDNVHSAELLPNGNIAVAASDGNWVRVYTSSQGPDSTSYAQFTINFAHAVLWDPGTNRLWVNGYDAANNEHILTALIVGGTAASPTLTEDTSRRAVLPTVWAHDTYPVTGNTDRLWVSTNLGVHQYVKSTNAFDPNYPNNASANRTFVKGIGNLPSGQIVETKPDSTKSPAGACTLNGWCTDTVDFYGPSATRSVTGAAFYKSRVWSPDYYANDGVEDFGATTTALNDTSGSITYSGTWGSGAFDGYYNGDQHFSNTSGSYAQYTFVGTAIRWIGSQNYNHGKVDVYIDGVFQETIDTYAPTWNKQQTLYAKYGLPKGSHTIKIQLRSDKNSASSGYYNDIDAFFVDTDTTNVVNDASASITYTGTWGSGAFTGYFNGDQHYSNMPGSYAQYSFTGTMIKWIGSQNYNHGKVDVYIDGVYQATVDTYAPTWNRQRTLFAKYGLSSGTHTIKIQLRSDKNSSSSGFYNDIDAFVFK